MITIKVTIYLAVLLSVLAIFSDSLITANKEIENSILEFDSKLIAVNCASLINSFYANSGGILRNLQLDCYLNKENIVAASANGIEKTSSILNNSTKVSVNSDLFKFEIKIRERYEK